MASGDQRPLYQQSGSETIEKRSDYQDRREPDACEVGFRFECQQGCSACCEMEGEVYLTEADLVRIALYIGMSPLDFEYKYVQREKYLLRLRKPPVRQCMFHQGNRCSIHAVKPTQCRVFPYWPELIESREAWEEAAGYCPGMNKGPLIQIEAAKQLGEEMLAAYPSMYP